MGKRKAKAMQPKKNKLPKLDKEFDCPFCSHPRAVAVKMDRGRNIGTLGCRICGTSYEKRINRLDEPIDIYGAWIDACVTANTQAAEQAQKKMGSTLEGEESVLESGVPVPSRKPRASREERPGVDSGDDLEFRRSPEASADEEGEASEEDVPRNSEEKRTGGARLKRLRKREESSEDEGSDHVSGRDTDSAGQEDALRVLKTLREQQRNEEDAGSGRDEALFEDDE
ncbi:putative transcription elongation factor 1 [Toxoplasma gondii TgCatPRC2]|uniref:Transcription elongation factor 1 homolog n=1 Tax=Toxoplasma gondii TgCatPRC2 TaxID=1130821 RepID=A0A151H1Z4_TOXGO|nr:putative transcription elongation factor 1 [Toxoplasma gondii TgCatPRC2]